MRNYFIKLLFSSMLVASALGRCHLPDCSNTCQYYGYDNNGCPGCNCVSEKPPCPTCTCPDGATPVMMEIADNNGCSVCTCIPPGGQPSNPSPGPCPTCTCPNGAIPLVTEIADNNGCSVCNCMQPGGQPSIPSPEQTPISPPACITCLMFCEHGMKMGRDGCPICECNPPPSCQGVTCRSGEVCVMTSQMIQCHCPQNAPCDCPPPKAECVSSPALPNQSPPLLLGQPQDTESSCSRLRCGPDEECKMAEAVCPEICLTLHCSCEPVAKCFRKQIACPEWACPHYCPDGYLVDDSGCKSLSCICAPTHRPTCDTKFCAQGEHCEMQYLEDCSQDASCSRSPVCVRDGESKASCEIALNVGLINDVPLLYYQPRDGCPSGSKLIYMSSDGTEICCRSQAIHSDKPACENGAPQFTAMTFQCGRQMTPWLPEIPSASRFFDFIPNRNRSCRPGMVCTQHVDGHWSVCCERPPSQLFRFNYPERYRQVRFHKR